VRDSRSGEERMARLKVPEGLPRLLATGRTGFFVPLDEVIAHFLPGLFPGMEILERAVFRVTRDANVELADQADDLLEELQLGLRRRRFGEVIRLEVSDSISKAMLAELEQALAIDDDQIYPVRGLLDLSTVAQVALLDRPDLKFQPWRGVIRAPFLS